MACLADGGTDSLVLSGKGSKSDLHRQRQKTARTHDSWRNPNTVWFRAVKMEDEDVDDAIKVTEFVSLGVECLGQAALGAEFSFVKLVERALVRRAVLVSKVQPGCVH